MGVTIFCKKVFPPFPRTPIPLYQQLFLSRHFVLALAKQTISEQFSLEITFYQSFFAKFYNFSKISTPFLTETALVSTIFLVSSQVGVLEKRHGA